MSVIKSWLLIIKTCLLPSAFAIAKPIRFPPPLALTIGRFPFFHNLLDARTDILIGDLLVLLDRLFLTWKLYTGGCSTFVIFFRENGGWKRGDCGPLFPVQVGLQQDHQDAYCYYCDVERIWGWICGLLLLAVGWLERYGYEGTPPQYFGYH